MVLKFLGTIFLGVIILLFISLYDFIKRVVIFTKGRKAYLSYINKTHNPYDPVTQAEDHLIWDNGWDFEFQRTYPGAKE